MPRRWCKRALGFLTVLIAQGAMGGWAFAQDPSGRAVGVIPDASALGSEGSRTLAVQQPVYMGDRIQTGSTGEAQIHFIDDTRLVVGAASSLLIDSSVLRNRRTMTSFVVSMLRGSFRFISGTSPKPIYAIRTPTATIGVRGTQFDIAVLPNGGTEFVLLHGQARICDRSGTCLLAQRACSAVTVPPSGPMRALVDPEERNERLRTYFPYVRNQYANLRQEFRANVGACGNIAAVRPPIGDERPFGVSPFAARAPEVSRPTPPRPTPDVPRSPRTPEPPVTSPPNPLAPTPTLSGPVTSLSPPSAPAPSWPAPSWEAPAPRTDKPSASTPRGPRDDPGGRTGGPGNGNGNAGNRGNGGGNVHGDGPGTGNRGTNNGQGAGAVNGGGGYGNGGVDRGGGRGADTGSYADAHGGGDRGNNGARGDGRGNSDGGGRGGGKGGEGKGK